MKRTGQIFGLTLAFVSLGCLLTPPALAGSPHGSRGSGIGKALSSGRSQMKLRGSDSSRAIRGMGRSLSSSGRSSGVSHGGAGNADAWRQLGQTIGNNLRNHNGNGYSGYGNSHGYGNGYGHGYGNGYGGRHGNGYGNGYGGHYGYQDNDMAGAYRDVGIANAIVGLVGIAAQASQPYPYGAYGQYARERVLVSPAHYETTQVWIPEMVDARTGARIGGYYETRTQYVPDVYQERNVQVVTPAPVYTSGAYVAGPIGPPPMPPVPMMGR